MPELPEVETIRYDLNKALSGYTIVDLAVDTSKMIKPSEEVVRQGVLGLQISSFRRRAKLLIIELEKELCLHIHLKMTGRLLIRNQKDEKDRWTRVVFFLKKGKDNKELRFADQRKFGYVRLSTEIETEKILSQYGAEPLDDLTLNVFREILKKRKLSIKKLLMDQKTISGIGNIYANDALFLANIHPERKACNITREEIEKLFLSIESVLKKGLKYRGASDNSYLDAFGKKGQYQEHFLVYRKHGEKCQKCQNKIKRFSLGGRGTFYCPSCQK